jgi:hypothetical protein
MGRAAGERRPSARRDTSGPDWGGFVAANAITVDHRSGYPCRRDPSCIFIDSTTAAREAHEQSAHVVPTSPLAVSRAAPTDARHVDDARPRHSRS